MNRRPRNVAFPGDLKKGCPRIFGKKREDLFVEIIDFQVHRIIFSFILSKYEKIEVFDNKNKIKYSKKMNIVTIYEYFMTKL